MPVNMKKWIVVSISVFTTGCTNQPQIFIQQSIDACIHAGGVPKLSSMSGAFEGCQFKGDK